MKKILITLLILTSQFVFSQDLTIKDFYKNQNTKLIESITFYTEPDSLMSDKIEKSESILSLTKLDDNKYLYVNNTSYVNGLTPVNILFIVDCGSDRYKISAYDSESNNLINHFQDKDGLVVSNTESVDGLVELKLAIINIMFAINRSIGGKLYN